MLSAGVPFHLPNPSCFKAHVLWPVLCDLVKSLLLSELLIDSAKSLQGLAWVI